MFPIHATKSAGNHTLKYVGNIIFPTGVEKHMKKHIFRAGIAREIPTKHKILKIIILQIKIL